MVAKTREKIAASVEAGHAPNSNVIPMIDRSGSMSGGPDYAAIGLGILFSELSDPRFGNTVLTFASNPAFVQLDPRLSFHERVLIVTRIEAGVSTNFGRAMKLILGRIREQRLTPAEFPALCILSDEQMNNGTMFGYSKTVDRGIKSAFEDLGMELVGEPYPRPRTIHWNLRGDTTGHAVAAHENNVQAITGYSASLVDLVITGKPSPTPYETMRRKLDESRYDPIRKVVHEWIDEIVQLAIRIEQLPDQAPTVPRACGIHKEILDILGIAVKEDTELCEPLPGEIYESGHCA
jgi:hypothetical protein